MAEPNREPVDFIEHLCAARGIGRKVASELLIEYVQTLYRRLPHRPPSAVRGPTPKGKRVGDAGRI
jgi:hypothetical protein